MRLQKEAGTFWHVHAFDTFNTHTTARFYINFSRVFDILTYVGSSKCRDLIQASPYETDGDSLSH